MGGWSGYLSRKPAQSEMGQDGTKKAIGH